MIKIVKKGQRTFAATCGVCGCIFTYESEDVQDALKVPLPIVRVVRVGVRTNCT